MTAPPTTLELPEPLAGQSLGAAPCSLFLGDCMEIVKEIPSATVDMVLIDPPYSMPTVASFGRQVTKRLSDLAIQEHYFGALKPELERILKHDAPLMIFCDDIYYAVLVGLFYDWKQINLLIWDKRRIGMGKPFRRRHECLFYANRGTPPLTGEMSHIPTVLEYPLTKEHHGAEKPLALCEQMIRELTPEGGCVVDRVQFTEALRADPSVSFRSSTSRTISWCASSLSTT